MNMSSEQNKVILRAEHISKTYGEKKVLEDISIHLEQGELVSLLGVSGSGKTTLFNVLSGIITPDEGKVYLKNQNQNRLYPFPTPLAMGKRYGCSAAYCKNSGVFAQYLQPQFSKFHSSM